MDKVLETLEGWDAGHVLALINAVGGSQNAIDIANGNKKVTLEDVILPLFDRHGRYISRNLKCAVVDANRQYKLKQPKLDYAACLARTIKYYGAIDMTPAKFKAKADELMARLKAMPGYGNVFCGVHLPLIIPKIIIDGDFGEFLEGFLLSAVEKAYKDVFPGRTFNNYRKGELKEMVDWVTESRYGLLMNQLVNGPTVAWYFPTALHGFSILADRELMSNLAEGFFLSGVIDISVAISSWCEVLARDGNTPALDCAANTWRSERSLYFNPRDGGLYFDYGCLYAHEDCSGGLLFVG